MGVRRDELVIERAGSLEVWTPEDSGTSPHRAAHFTVRSADGTALTEDGELSFAANYDPPLREFAWTVLERLEHWPEMFNIPTTLWAQLHHDRIQAERQRLEDELWPLGQDVEG